MNTTHYSPMRLLTWLDVERSLKQATQLWNQLPAGIVAVDCFASGMDIYHNADESSVDDWLRMVFGRLYNTEQRKILLKIGNSHYPVCLIQDESMQHVPAAGYPLWKDVVYLAGSDSEEDDDSQIAEGGCSYASTSKIAPVSLKSGPELVSFHSFKGGVGRTSALMTYVAACFAEQTSGTKRILVIDADLEAPGVSFWLETSNKPDVSFVQLLEALHYPPTDVDDVLDYFAAELKKTSYSVSGLEREVFVLPAALQLNEIQDMPVAPEHLARNPTNPWQLTDHLHALGQKLGVDAVFIDLRAGLSELASPLLFDPRIDHFFVTTVAPQSVLGMAEVLRRLHAYNCRLDETTQEQARPTVILSLLTKELRNSDYYQNALKQLGEAYPSTDLLAQQIQWLEADFNNSLMSIGTLEEALRRLKEAVPLFSAALDWAQALYALQSALPINSDKTYALEGENRQQLISELHRVCKEAAFAEGSALGNLLAIEPLLNLGKHFSNELPSTLMIGAKGAGKTFTFRQLVQSKNWQTFLGKLGFDSDSMLDASVFPVLWSTNVDHNPDGEIRTAQAQALHELNLPNSELIIASKLNKHIEAALQSPPNHWDDFWDDIIVRQFGMQSGGLDALNELLRAKNKRLVLTFDGIEDAFTEAGKEPANEAIESLLKLPNRINELSSSHLGVIVFVRVDYVQDVIRQNFGQLLSRYEPFRLHWNAESFLRLAYMLSCQAGLYQDPKKAETLGLEELKLELERLWGKKLGSERSKEAHSARWVYAALCDLKGNIQARDLVRFLEFASDFEKDRPAQTWGDRLLAPESMRKAIKPCSEKKIDEAKAEISVLRAWIDKIDSEGRLDIKVPFSAEQAGLESKMLNALKDLGVIYEDMDSKLGNERLYVPEIYRYGLGFDTSAAGRPRTQALLKKNIGSIPL